MRIGLLGSVLFATATSTASAQQPADRIQPPAASVLFARVGPIAADTAERRLEPTHWKRGLVIGGVLGGAGLGGLLYLFCEGLNETQSSCIELGLGGAAIGAVIGGTVGALIGGQFPQRDQEEPVADSTAASPES